MTTWTVYYLTPHGLMDKVVKADHFKVEGPMLLFYDNGNENPTLAFAAGYWGQVEKTQSPMPPPFSPGCLVEKGEAVK